jgi:hypothetical protein
LDVLAEATAAHPIPALRNFGPMRESSPIPVKTCTPSAPTPSQILAISFANPIFMAKKAFAAYLKVSALVRVVSTRGTRDR